MKQLIESIFAISKDIRYIAVYHDGNLSSSIKNDIAGASSSESDKYEELIVNPTILTLVNQRGNIDCGGAEYVLIRYGNFYQFVTPIPKGHVSVCIEPVSDPLKFKDKILTAIRNFNFC